MGYSNPVYACTTGVGCCLPTAPPIIVREMIKGVGLYTSPKDNLEQKYYWNSLRPKFEDALKSLTNEMRNGGIFESVIKGAFLDAQTFNQALVTLEKQTTETLLNETPSEQICRFGSLSKSLAGAEEKAKVTQLSLSKNMLDREMMRSGTAASSEKDKGQAIGRASDKLSRYQKFKSTFCQQQDFSGELKSPACVATDDTQQNRDIDIVKTLQAPLTLNIDFSSPTALSVATKDEENIIALGENFYAHNLPLSFDKGDFKNLAHDLGDKDSEKFLKKITDYRSITAKRSIAQNSYATLAAMRTETTSTTAQYLKEMAAMLGLSTGEQNKLIGDKPSYYAQMEFLTRGMYQTPAFYVNLVESKSNVARQQTAMEAIGLMQDRDIYKSLQRSEMLLSTLLETYIAEKADNTIDKGGKQE